MTLVLLRRTFLVATPLALAVVLWFHPPGGDKIYEGVRDDVENWVPRVVRGGIVVFDDYTNPLPGVGAKRAIDELLTTGLVEPKLRQTSDFHVWTRRL